jgi:hypothetical protein
MSKSKGWASNGSAFPARISIDDSLPPDGLPDERGSSSMRGRVRPILLCFCAIIFFLAILTNALSAQEPIIKVGDFFPEVPLKPHDDPKDIAYLGIPEDKSFTIKDVQADLVLIEILNVYCDSCEKQVPVYNKLYALIESEPETKGRIKMVGIGVANEDWEVKHFRKRFKVSFPVFADPDSVMHKAIGGSPPPFSIFIRQDPTGKAGLVVGAHSSVTYEHEELFWEMQSMMDMDLAAIREKGRKTEAKVVYIEPILTEEELQARIKMAFAKEGDNLTRFEKVKLESSGAVYTGAVQKNGQAKRLFAKVFSRPPPCNVCHDIHFIYVFDATGKILQFIPLQLAKYVAKYGNVAWNEADVAKIREHIVGKYVYKPFVFDAKVDAVTSATITSAVIFKGLNDGQALFDDLKEKGLI